MPIVVLALFHAVIRLSGLMHFPAFIDESWHIVFAQDVLAGHLIAGAAHGKLLVPMLIAPLLPTGGAQLFIARAATALFSLISFGLVYRLTADLVSHVAAWFALLLYSLNPYLIFYERMALIDTYMMTFGLLAVWAASKLRYRVQIGDAVLCGLALIFGLAAKGTGVVLLVIPLAAPILVWHAFPRRRVIRWLFVCYGLFAAIWLPLYGLLRWRRINYFGLAETLSNTQIETDFVQRLVSNISGIWQIDTTYFSLLTLLIMLALIAYGCIHHVRRGLYILACALIPTFGILLLSPISRSRYLSYHVPLLLIAAAAGFEAFRQTASRWSSGRLIVRASTGVALIWLGGIALVFYGTLLLTPARLVLPAVDASEYITADSSGFALPELAKFMESETQSVHWIGLLANCDGLRLYLVPTRNITLDCPTIAWDGSQQSTLAELVNQRAQNAALYLIVENLPYVSTRGITVPLQWVTSFERPGGSSILTVYVAAH